jgi:bifunctional DNase/RNase
MVHIVLVYIVMVHIVMVQIVLNLMSTLILRERSEYRVAAIPSHLHLSRIQGALPVYIREKMLAQDQEDRDKGKRKFNSRLHHVDTDAIPTRT